MFRRTASSLTCGMMAVTMLASSVAMAADDPLRGARQQRNDFHHNSNQQQRSSVGINHTQRQNDNNRRWDNDRNDHRGRGRGHDDRRYDNHRHHNSGSRVVVNVNRSYPHYYNNPYYYPRPIYYRERYPAYYYSSYYTQRPIPIIQESPYVEVRCTQRPIIGTVVGGAAGGLIGNQFGRGHSDRGLATLGGVLLGAIIGNSVDRADESCAYQALEYAQPNTQVAWVNPDDDYSYTVTPGAISKENGRYCREYQANVMVGGRLQEGYGRACRQPDGSWEVVD